MARIDLQALARVGGIESVRLESNWSNGGLVMTVFDDEGADMIELTQYQVDRLARFIDGWLAFYSASDRDGE